MPQIVTQGPQNITFREESVVITCTEAVTKGTLVSLIITDASGDVPVGFSSCDVADTADVTPDQIIGVATDTVAAGSKGKIVLRGVVDIKCDTAVAKGSALQASASNGGNADVLTAPAGGGTTRLKCIGVALVAASSDGDLCTSLFDGVSGFSAGSA